MYRRRPRSSSKSNIQLTGSNRGSDITQPNNTSLIVQRSRISEEPEEELPKSVTALLYDDDDDDSDSMGHARPSTSLLNSMSQKKQSTPQKQKSRILRESNSLSSKSRATSVTETDSSFAPQEPQSRSNTFQKSKSTKKTLPQCLFLKTLSDCGTEEIDGDASFRLSEDQAVFIRKVHENLKNADTLRQFVKSFEEYMQNDEKLKKLVMFTQTSGDCEVARGPVQESMLRLLLLVDCIQGDVLLILLNRLKNIINRTNPQNDDILLITGILKQVQCLSRVQNTKFGSQLLLLMDNAPSLIQKEIIFVIPELIVEDELEETTKKLADMLQEGTELTPIVIDSLGNLPLTRTLKVKVCEQVMNRLERYPPTFLPNLVQFILSRSDPQDQAQIIMTLREKLPFSAAGREELSSTLVKNRGAEMHIRKVFENIMMALKASKAMTEAWLKIITGIGSPNELRPVDLMILILIHGHVLGRKASTLTLIKNRIRAGVLTDSHISTTFKVLRIVVTENHKEVVDLASSLLKSFENIIADLAILMYQEIFAGCGPFLRQDVVSDLVMHLTTGSPSSISHALALLLRLRDSEEDALEQYAASFMSTLRVLPSLDLNIARQLTDVIAGLVSAPSQKDSGLVEEFWIFIQKQLSAWQQETQHRGVVAAVMAIKHFAIQSKDQTDDLVESNVLLKMAAGTQRACATRRTFFYDEIASMLKETNARPAFLTAWIDRIYVQTLETAFASSLELECDYFPMTLQYSIENGGNLVCPIVGFIVNPKTDAYINATTMPAAMRILWCSSKDIGRVSPMMCAAVILPDNSVFDKFLTYAPSEQKMIMDCLFLCANYFLECVNALSTQKTSEKLIIRVKQLIEVRKLILKYVGQIPNYSPISCQFHVPANKPVLKKQASEGGKKPTRGRKRKADGKDVVPSQSNLDNTVLPATSTAAAADALAQLPTLEESADLSCYASFFRELHCHSYKLLRMELKLNPSKVFKKKKMSDLIAADVSWSYRPEDKPELGPSDTLFLLQDYLVKSDQILRERPWFLNRKPSGLVTESMSAISFINGTVKLLPKLCLKLDVVNRYCKDLLDSNDGVWDAPGCFPNDSADIKKCYSSLLKIISDVLAWRGFQSPTNKDLLKDILFILSRKTAVSSTQASGSLAMDAARFLSGLSSSLHLLSGAVYLTRSVHSCIQLSGSKDFSLVGDLCGEILKRPWFTVTGALDRGAAYNQLIDSLIRMHLACAEDRLALILTIAEISADEVPGLLTKDSPLITYTSLNKSNFPLLYRAMCETLATAASEQLIAKKDSDEDRIEIWSVVVRTLLILVEIAKVHISRTNLAALLKRSQNIIQQFLTKGLPVMENALRVKSDDVLKILKSLQAVTRFLHSVCCHSKMTSDAVVAAHVPNIRALCERLTLEVKGMLILNKIPLECITIAVLKNRDIQGNAILSQSTIATSDDESELPVEEEEVPEEDDGEGMETESNVDHSDSY